MKLQGIFGVLLINLLLLMVLIIIGSFVLRGYFALNNDEQNLNNDEQNLFNDINKNYNSNTIRSTYPVYENTTPSEALNIFTDYEKPDTTYYPFTGWRRSVYTGKSVNVISELRTRASINHKIDNSIWFFGGSTMWGTGSNDNDTIPSQFAKLTNENVLNLGESSYLSFQEYVHLSILLAKGLKPKKVVFYDGVNDSYYCNTNNEQFPSHSRAERWTEYIGDYPNLMKKHNELKNIIKENKLENVFKTVYEYLKSPYDIIYQLSFSDKVIGRTLSSKRANMNTSIPMREYLKTENYKNCDTSEIKLRKASETTVNTWLMAYDLLQAIGIKFYVFLQPTSQISRSTLNLDYLIDDQKQRIANEEDSHKARYEATKREWYKKCEAHNACDSFYDISAIFDHLSEDIYIDAVHIGPEGNKLIAKEIQKILIEYE